MKTKLLSTIRKHYDYLITKEGKVVTRSKKHGTVKEYDSIQEYVKDVSYTDTLIERLFSYKWNEKKKFPWSKESQIINDTKVVRSNDYWDFLVTNKSK